MDNDDELVPEPDARGFLDLTNRAWVNLDPSIFNYTMKLVVLDVSYNHIQELPMQIGELTLLREFRASFNKLNSIPPEIGKLKRLRKLILNGNRIKTLPPDIGKLEMLEELVLSENKLEELPLTISFMATLRVLKLQNNNIRSLPHSIADLLTLEVIDCSNNPELEMLPAAWRGDTNSILFTCRIHRDYNVKMDEMLTTNNDLMKHAQYLEQEQLVMKEKMDELRVQIEDLNKFMPKSARKKMDKALKAASDVVNINEPDKQSTEKCVIS